MSAKADKTWILARAHTSSSTTAAEWLETLNHGVRATISRYDKGALYRPAKIAIIDTGACIDELVIDMKYDGRLKECRSWLDESDGATGRAEGFNSDPIGHGTHATSLALESSMHSNCEVYVARVFATRLGRQSIEAQCETHAAIAQVCRIPPGIAGESVS